MDVFLVKNNPSRVEFSVEYFRNYVSNWLVIAQEECIIALNSLLPFKHYELGAQNLLIAQYISLCLSQGRLTSAA